MKAWVKRNGRLKLEEVPVPTRGADEVLVRVRAISLNRGEIRTVGHAPDGEVPGWDIAGTVEAGAQDGSGPPAGSPVVALLSRGGWAEFAAVPAAHIASVPNGVELEAAATLPVAALTVVRALDIGGSLIGKTVLITGGSGGVGQFAIQLGVSAGATVTAISSRGDQREALRSLGASEVVSTIDDADGPFDLILESVGGSSLAAAVERVARDGVIVTIGNSSEQETTFNARTLYAKGGARIYGLLIFKEAESRRVGAADLTRLLGMLRDGKLRAPVEVRRTWTDLPAVLDDFERRVYSGKAVLTVG
jgi:NADPH2:quinone reductase